MIFLNLPVGFPQSINILIDRKISNAQNLILIILQTVQFLKITFGQFFYFTSFESPSKSTWNIMLIYIFHNFFKNFFQTQCIINLLLSHIFDNLITYLRIGHQFLATPRLTYA